MPVRRSFTRWPPTLTTLDEDGHVVAHAPVEPGVDVAHGEPHGCCGYVWELLNQARADVLKGLVLIHLDHRLNLPDLGCGHKWTIVLRTSIETDYGEHRGLGRAEPDGTPWPIRPTCWSVVGWCSRLELRS